MFSNMPPAILQTALFVLPLYRSMAFEGAGAWLGWEHVLDGEEFKPGGQA